MALCTTLVHATNDDVINAFSHVRILYSLYFLLFMLLLLSWHLSILQSCLAIKGNYFISICLRGAHIDLTLLSSMRDHLSCGLQGRVSES